MIRLQETIEIPRPIAEVFAYASNFSNAAQRDPGVVDSCKISRDPVGFGMEAAKVSGVFWLDRVPHTAHVFPGTDPSPQGRQQLCALETAQRGR